MLQSVQLRRLDGPVALVVRQASQHVTCWRLWWAKTPIQDALPESCATSPPSAHRDLLVVTHYLCIHEQFVPKDHSFSPFSPNSPSCPSVVRRKSWTELDGAIERMVSLVRTGILAALNPSNPCSPCSQECIEPARSFRSQPVNRKNAHSPSAHKYILILIAHCAVFHLTV